VEKIEILVKNNLAKNRSFGQKKIWFKIEILVKKVWFKIEILIKKVGSKSKF